MPVSPDESEELRREMEVHLRFLEDEARMQAETGGHAPHGAADRFGDAVSHFRNALEDMSLRQRAMRQLLIVGLVVGAFGLVGGVFATVFILRSVESELVDLRSELTATDANLNQAAVTCAILIGRWEDPPGQPNSLRMPVTLSAWNSWVATTGLECGPGESPGFMWVSEGWVAQGYRIREGQAIWFSIERLQDMSPELADLAGTAFPAISKHIRTSGCVPRDSRLQASH